MREYEDDAAVEIERQDGEDEWEARDEAPAAGSDVLLQVPEDQEENIADRHVQLRALYRVLLKRQGEFDEFRMILASYPWDQDEEHEPMEATAMREIATVRARQWTDMPIERFSPKQMELWRKLLIEDRDNVAISPWRESNMY